MERKSKRDLLMQTNRRLQKISQELFMAKQREQRQKEQLQQELNALKKMSMLKSREKAVFASRKKLTKPVAEDLSLSYIQLLKTYLDVKDLNKEEPLIEELCRSLLEYGITPKGIIDLHLKAVPQIGTIGGLETKRITFEARMVLLAVMTKYASLLREKH